MIITALTIKDFKRISDVKIEPGDAAVIIGGRNKQGKSTTLDAIEAALLGGRAAPKDPIRHGAKSARIVLVTDTGMTVTREFSTRGASKLKVEGGGEGTPQAILDALVGPVSFEPMKFKGLAAKEQAATLRQLSGVDTRKLEARRAVLFSERTTANGDLKKTTARLEAAPHHKDAPADLVSVSDLSAKLSAAVDHNSSTEAAAAEAVRAADGAKAWGESVDGKAKKLAEAETASKKMGAVAKSLRETCDAMKRADTDEIRAEIAALSASLNEAIERNAECDTAAADAASARDDAIGLAGVADKLSSELAEADTGAKKAKAVAGNLRKKAESMTRQDTTDISAAIAGAEEVNNKVRDNKAHEGLAFEVDAAREESERLTGEMKAIDDDIAAQTAAAKYPIDGLSVDDDGISYNGVTFDQASDAEQITVCMAIGLALNKKLNVVRIRKGSELDDESLALVVKMAEDAGAQAWIERVGKGGECTHYIEDGAVL